ncbi:MAG: hypothetical protein GOMPHAMPRED_004087 [Gomphillus americanus]|uniref:UBC core domain-containing protein n=1 Tax=Gomphillus americanus TaxID=1940652 RepID=A0A8H3IFM2_9LECA|nr:MAG: hypothetical protein GOMPHAMPRED_004087 [Gomphillus americanus]
MPRKEFVRDLQEAQTGALPQNVISLLPGQDDGTFILLFQCPDSEQIQIHAQVSDVGDYPRSHSFFIFTDSEDIPQSIHSALHELSVLSEVSVSRTVTQVAAALNHAVDVSTQDEDIDLVAEEEDSDEVYQSDEFPIGEEDAAFHVDDNEDFTSPAETPTKSQRFATLSLEKDEKAFSDRVRQDVSKLKQAGFHVSHQGNILRPGTPCLLMVSIRVAKLKLPDDVLEAWHLHPSEYIVLLFKYRKGYCNLQMLGSSSAARHGLIMHILVAKKRKLTVAEVMQATENRKGSRNDSEIAEKVNDLNKTTRPLFIGTALEELLNSRLVTLIQFRLELKLNWAGAMAFYNAKQGEIRTSNLDSTKFVLEEDVSKILNLSKYIQADSLQETPPGHLEEQSFPCIAMQFALRHIVRCTEFCLVCFDKTKDDFEALKPYVCSKPLCLYQYMAMGLGPGIEFEILSQKHVVDLLVSFCYHSAVANGLRSLPIGLGLMVPDPRQLPKFISPHPQYLSTTQRSDVLSASRETLIPEHGAIITASWNPKLSEIILIQTPEPSPEDSVIKTTFKVGDWLVFWASDCQLHHCQLSEKSHPKYCYRTVVHANRVPKSEEQNSQDTKDASSDSKTKKIDLNLEAINIRILPYGTLFDSLSTNARHAAIRILLDTLPSVNEMGEYLRTTRGLRVQLSGWTDRMIPAAVALLRWIIASNRSCIVYNEKPTSDEVVHGMPGFLQFRFASGAPDKESRFVKSVKEVQGRLNQESPTIFAWHGSPLKNWHSIIREGLNFDQIIHGRAYGNGVYHALLAQISLGYSSRTGDPNQSWPSSVLDVHQVLSLNEIVNAPLEFESRNPHLVVQNIDWIQTRYLFVRCGKRDVATNWELRSKPSLIMKQDSRYFPVDDRQMALTIPACAISKSRRKVRDLEGHVTGNFKRNTVLGRNNQISISDDSDIGHETYLDDSDSSEDSLSESRQKQKDSISLAVTPFKLGGLNRSNLPMLAPPTYATSIATRALHREIHSMLTEQLETPPAKLGWYFDPGHVDNVYHWIVELHSFDKNLPLAKDMLEWNVESIVLEIRFGPNFNFSPPFIRVIQPRFLSFAQGGGGHVTAGGAICMELLTSNGWNPSSTMSAVLLQVRMAITSTDPKPARLERGNSSNGYSCGEAAQAYTRACQMHGWKVPDDFSLMTSMIEMPRTAISPKADNGQQHQQTGTSIAENNDDDDGEVSLMGQPDLKKRRHT